MCGRNSEKPYNLSDFSTNIIVSIRRVNLQSIIDYN